MIRLGSEDEVQQATVAEGSLYGLYHENSKLVQGRGMAGQPGMTTGYVGLFELPRRRGFEFEMVGLDASPADALRCQGRQATLAEAFAGRRSANQFSSSPISRAELARLLISSYHVNGSLVQERGTLELRTAPSAGGFYPVELYVAAIRISNFDPGIYHYVPAEAALEPMELGRDPAAEISRCCGESQLVDHASGAVVLTVRPQRTVAKYGERAYRYLLIETGHIAQNLCLAAAVLGIGVRCLGGFYDDLVNRLVQVDGLAETAVYVLLFGGEARTAHQPEGRGV